MSYASNLIRAIQTGRKRLGLDDEDYRALLASVSNGKTSSKDLTTKELQLALERLREAGFRPVTQKQINKLKALWHSMADEGIVRTDTEAALAAYVRRITRKNINACGSADLSRVIETLKKWILRLEDQDVKERLEKELTDMPLIVATK